MKIAYITHETFFPPKGGGAVRVLNIAKAFAKKGHRVILFAPYGELYSGEKEIIPEVAFIPVSNIERFKTKNKEIAYIKFLFLLTSLLIKEKFDLLFSHIAVAGTSGALVKTIKRKPAVIDLDDIISGFSGISFIKRYGPTFEFFIPAFYDRVVCMSESLAKRVSMVKKNNVFVVPHGADFDLFYPGGKCRGKRHFVFSGGIEKHDGVDLILMAAKDLIYKYPDMKITILGDGSELSRNIELSRELGLLDVAEFKGWLEHERVPEYLRHACAGIVSDRRRTATEVALVVRGVEYMASGIPVIAPDHSGTRELLGDGERGIIFRSGDYLDLASKMAWVMDNPDEAYNLGMKGFNYAEINYCWEKNAERIVEICETLYREKRS